MDAPPNGYRYCSVQQVLAADVKLWQVVAQESLGHLSITPGTAPPLDSFITSASSNPLVIARLTPLPKAVEAAPALPHVPKGPKGKGKEGKGNKGQKGRGKSASDQGAAPQNTSLFLSLMV